MLHIINNLPADADNTLIKPSSLENGSAIFGAALRRQHVDTVSALALRQFAQGKDECGLLNIMDKNGLLLSISEMRRLIWGGQPAITEVLYRRVLEGGRHDAVVRNLLGLVDQERGRNEEAIAHFRESARISPKRPEVYNNLAAVLGRLGRHSEAKDAAEAALRLRPDYPEAANNLAAALEQLQLLDQAEEACRRALRLRPNDSLALLNLSNILRKLHRPREAVHAAEGGLRWGGPQAVTLNTLGAALLELRDVARARCCFEEAIRRDPKCVIHDLFEDCALCTG